jgi:hypothetical protein
MDIEARLPGEGEIASVAKARECEPARLILRAIREQRDIYTNEILAQIDTMPAEEIRSVGGKAAGLDEVLKLIETAKKMVVEKQQGDGHEDA